MQTDISSASASSNLSLEQKAYDSDVLYKNVWKGIEAYLTPGCNVYFAPTGILHQLAIEYAPTDDGKLFCEKYKVHRVSSTRNLVLHKREIPIDSVCIYGGINYRDKSIPYLEGTKKEMDEISKYFSDGNISTECISGDDADRESFLALSGKNTNILHIATHGYFSDQEGNSLDNSGLVFADGILTSEKISEMDLSNTDLVVLSACETAKGSVNSDGVFGLQRAFKLAGAKTIIMSLWPVNDYATMLLMKKFYSNMIEKKMPKREAFDSAILELKSKKGTTPFHWAAFIMLDD